MSIASILNNIENGRFDEQIMHLYVCDQQEVLAKRERIANVVRCFSTRFGGEYDPRIFSAPGRTELGGNHTDHQRGRVVAASVSLDALCAAAPSGDNTVCIISEGYAPTEFEIGQGTAEKKGVHTEALVRGIIDCFIAKGYNIGGFNIYSVSDVPGGSGLSSSAAFAILIGTVINNLFCDGKEEAMTIARMGQTAENEYCGKMSGLLDQAACACGGVVAIDFAIEGQPEVKRLDVDFGKYGYTLCVVNTGGSHAGLDDLYSSIPLEMRSVARALGGTVLSEVSSEDFYANLVRLRESVGDRAVMRAMHYFDETERAREQSEALEAGDFARYLELVEASGSSSLLNLQNVCVPTKPEEQSVALGISLAKRMLDQCGGVCRVHGGGFAGTMQAYVPTERAEEFRALMDGVFGEGACVMVRVRPCGGAEFVAQ